MMRYSRDEPKGMFVGGCLRFDLFEEIALSKSEGFGFIEYNRQQVKPSLLPCLKYVEIAIKPKLTIFFSNRKLS